MAGNGKIVTTGNSAPSPSPAPRSRVVTSSAFSTPRTFPNTGARIVTSADFGSGFAAPPAPPAPPPSFPAGEIVVYPQPAPSPAPPSPPPLPSGSVLDLFADSGRSVVSSVLVDWSDAGHSISFTPPGGSTGPAVSPHVIQNFDGNLFAASTDELSNTGTALFTAGEPCTVVVAAQNTDAGGNISTPLRVGSSGKTRNFYAGGGFLYGDGTVNVSIPNLYLGSPWVMSWSVQPGTSGPTGRINGWPVAYPNTTSNPSGSISIDAGSSGVQVGNSDAYPPGYFHGYEQEVHAYSRLLNATDQSNVEGNLASKFSIIGVNGFISDSAAITFYGLGDEHMLFRAPYAATRLYTEATSLTLYTQQNTGAGVGVTNLPQLVILVDGVLTETYTVPTSTSPYAPTSTVLSLDGQPHIIEIWDGPPVQAGAATPTGAVLSSIQDSTGSTQLFPAELPANRLVVYTDSIGLGCGASSAEKGAFQMLRYTGTTFDGRISFFGGIGRSLHTDKLIDGSFNALANALVALAQEVKPGGRKIIWWEIGLNDFISATYSSAALWGTDAATVVALVHAADPDIEIILVGPIVAVGESTPNTSGYTLPDIRTQMLNIATANPSFVHFRDASQAAGSVPAVTTAQLHVDGYHPLDAGHLALNAWDVATMEDLGLPLAA